MQHVPDIRLMRRAIRSKICVECFMRPAGSEKLGPERARPCQSACSIFINLARLREIASTIHDPTMAPYETAMRELVCQTCAITPTSGDFCADRTTRTCPLSRYGGEVIETLEKLGKPASRSAKTAK